MAIRRGNGTSSSGSWEKEGNRRMKKGWRLHCMTGYGESDLKVQTF